MVLARPFWVLQTPEVKVFFWIDHYALEITINTWRSKSSYQTRETLVEPHCCCEYLEYWLRFCISTAVTYDGDINCYLNYYSTFVRLIFTHFKCSVQGFKYVYIKTTRANLVCLSSTD